MSIENCEQYEKKYLIDILQKATYFDILMYKENGKDIKLKRKHESDDSDNSDNDDKSDTCHWYWVMKERQKIRDELTAEKLGSFKNCQLLPSSFGDKTKILILFENLLVEIVSDKETCKKLNDFNYN